MLDLLCQFLCYFNVDDAGSIIWPEVDCPDRFPCVDVLDRLAEGSGPDALRP
jgi:hypothetical protein